MRRRLLLAVPLALPLAACGFKLRGAPNFAFSRLRVSAPPASQVGAELLRALTVAGNVQVLGPDTPPEQADALFELLSERRERVVVGQSASGQVRELQLRIHMRFRLRTPTGRELIPDTELVQQRDISFNETLALAKEGEEALLYRDMQADLAQQLMRRLAAVRQL